MEGECELRVWYGGGGMDRVGLMDGGSGGFAAWEGGGGVGDWVQCNCFF